MRCTGSPIRRRSRAFYEALGLEFRREVDIVRDGEREATNYFFGVPGHDEELELTFNRDGRTYELGTGYGHIAYAVDDLAATLERLGAQGIEPSRVLRSLRQSRDGSVRKSLFGQCSQLGESDVLMGGGGSRHAGCLCGFVLAVARSRGQRPRSGAVRARGDELRGLCGG